MSTDYFYGTQKFASAKHCYTIQTFMDMIDDNFLLLDSDMLLKKDISIFFDDDYIYVGHPKQQFQAPNRRLDPCICYINNKLCKVKNVRFFDDKRMLGLYEDIIGEVL